jgi:hypothetical protein
MTRLLLFVALAVVVAGGCRKAGAGPDQGGGSGGGGGFGAVQAVRGAVDRAVTAAELHDLHLFMTNAKLAMGRVPTAEETWAEISKPGGNPKLTKMIQDGLIILVAKPQEEGLWAYAKEAPTQGGWILSHSQPERVTAQEFATRYGGMQ